MKPILAIVGRPNVGKSTLFNRIIGRRKALTLDQPGVTRDRHYATAAWEGREFLVVDTGGLSLRPGDNLEGKVRGQVDLAIQEADVILFVLDGREGLIPEEREIGKFLMRSGRKVLTVINKVDGPEKEDQLADFFSLGCEVHPVSAEHGYRVNDLLDEVVRCLPPAEQEKEEASSSIRIAIIGRPNVGKSSLLNRLLGEERMIVHDRPGTTRDTIDTPLRVGSKDYLLIDTAGIRRGGRSDSRVERVSVLQSFKAIERSDVCLLLLDATQALSKQDAHIAGDVFDSRKGLVLVWNKCDLVRNKGKKGWEEGLDEEIKRRLAFLSYAPVIYLSAKTGEGCDAIWPAVNRLDDEGRRKISTSQLNDALEKLMSSHNPPIYKGKPVKLFYGTQAGVKPHTFLIFVNEPKGVHFSFERFLINGIRRLFALEGVPIRIQFRRKK